MQGRESESKPKLRSDCNLWLIGKLTEKLPLARIPSKGDVIRYLCYLKEFEFKQEKHGSGNKFVIDIVVDEVLKLWKKAGIPTQRKDKVKHKITVLYDNYKALQKNKDCAFNKQKEDEFVNSLAEYFYIADINAAQKIENDRLRNKEQKSEDLKFLELIKSGQKVCIGHEDKQYTKKVTDKIQRETVVAKRKLKYESDVTSLIGVQAEESCSVYKLTNECATKLEGKGDPDFTLPSSSKCIPNSKTVKIELPKNPFKSATIVQMADRLKLSLNQRTGLLASLAKESDLDLDELSLSRETVRRSSKTIRTDVAKQIKNNFTAPKNCVLHWDSKIMLDQDKNKPVDRLAILISGAPNCIEGKLLGVPVIQDGTAESQATKVFALVEEWGLSENISALCFDTTASNSGWKNGACVQLERLLNKKLLYLACRHHVLELIEGAVWRSVFGSSMSPDHTDFKEFQGKWSTLENCKNNFRKLQIKDRKLLSLQEDTVSFLKMFLNQEKNKLLRGDYRECAEIVLLLLGETPPRGVHWLKPGAFHKARWMSTIIYSGKMYAFSDHLGYDKEKVQKLHQICMFNAMIFVKVWLNATRPADAPVNDLMLWECLNIYKRFDPEVANAALETFNRHLWYVTEETVPFSLFSKKVSEAEKKKIAACLMKHKPDEHSLPTGVPVFPVLNQNTKLHDLVGPKSWLIFWLTKQDGMWLKKPPQTWEEDIEFKEMKTVVKKLKVVNDTAERGVKLMEDYNHSITKNEEEKQNLLHSVEESRKKTASFKKSALKQL